MKRLTFAVLLAWSGLAHAFEAGILYGDCRDGKPVCEAYFAGFTQAAFTYEAMRKGVPNVEPRFCPEGEVSVGRIVTLFKERMERYPELQDNAAISEVFRTLEEAFPCSAGEPPPGPR
ncbi:MAG: Rap1a/Tai family immunity protein [Chromatiales bacterium]|jgi:hypothetical protein